MGKKELHEMRRRGFWKLKPVFLFRKTPENVPVSSFLPGNKHSFQNIISIISLILLFQFINHCAPYSLPEKKTYSEKDDPYTYYIQSVKAYGEKNYPLALENINQSILLNKDMAKFYQMKGEIYRAQFDYTQALIVFNQALKKHSNFIDVHVSIGEIYQVQDQYDEAIRAYKRVFVLDPQKIDIILRIVQCYIPLDELDVAQYNLDIYEKSAQEYSMPLNDDYFLLRGEILFKLNKYEESITFLQSIRKPTQKSLKLQGLDYYRLGNYETGVSFFNKLLNIDKEIGEWYFYRGIYYYQKNDLKDAQTQFKHALSLDPGLTKTQYYLGKIYLANGDETAALEAFNLYRLESADPDFIDEVNELISSLNKK